MKSLWTLKPLVSFLLALQQRKSDDNNLQQKGMSPPQQPAISIFNLSCSHDGGSVYQLQDVTYFLPRNGKVGLVGRNGCGKSTMLQILASSCGCKNIDTDNLPYFSGVVETGKGCRIAYVEQEPFTDIKSEEILVGDALFGVTETMQQQQAGRVKSAFEAVQEYKKALLSIEANPDALTEASTAMDNIANAWTVLAKADETMQKLGVKELENQPVCKLSGGEKKRVALASALVQEPDVILLDEPTNHLDLVAIRWLSDLLAERKLTLLTVSHDRAFLDDVCESMIELDRGELFEYTGNYAQYLEQKNERLALEDALYAANKNKLKKELEWMRRQPQARETKQKARSDAFYKLQKATKPRVEDVALKLESKNRRLGNNILKLKDVSLKFGEKVILDSFSYDFNKGDKIGIVGGNGVGKSSFLKTLTGDLSIDSGEISTGETVLFGIYDQQGIEVEDDTQRLLEYVKECVEDSSGDGIAEEEARRLLRKFEFDKRRWNERVLNLSGGERRRLQLLTVITKKPNFLILDEPSNDVDLDTINALEDYLEEYNGVLVVVSHDRRFTDQVCDHLFVFEGNGIVKDYLGTLSEYSLALFEDNVNANKSTWTTSNKASSSIDGRTESEKKLSYKEEKEKRMGKRKELQKLKREMSSLERDMDKLRNEVEVLQMEIDESADKGWSFLADLTAKLDDKNSSLDEKELRWIEVAEILEEEDI